METRVSISDSGSVAVHGDGPAWEVADSWASVGQRILKRLPEKDWQIKTCWKKPSGNRPNYDIA